MQSCPVRHATQKYFNDFSNIDKQIFSPDPTSLLYGLSSFHAWIQIFECCLNISIRVLIKKGQIKSAFDKIVCAERKIKIQKNL
jgi:hypothetical protein